jgi:hypothetical protein
MPATRTVEMVCTGDTLEPLPDFLHYLKLKRYPSLKYTVYE